MLDPGETEAAMAEDRQAIPVGTFDTMFPAVASIADLIRSLLSHLCIQEL